MRFPAAFAACMRVRNGLPSGATETAPFSTFTPVDMAEAAAAESVTYGPWGLVTRSPSVPSRNTTSVVTNGCPRSTRLEYLPKSHCVDAVPSANMMMMFRGRSALRAPGPIPAHPARASATATNPQMSARRAALTPPCAGQSVCIESPLMFRPPRAS